MLLLRIEETAIGAVIGVGVAILVLPTNTRTTIRNDTRAFLTTLSALIETSIATMFDDDDAASPTEQARQLDRDLQQFRVTAKPLLAGVAGFAGRRSIQRSCDCSPPATATPETWHAAASSTSTQPVPEALSDAVTTAAAQTQRNIDALVAAIDGAHGRATSSRLPIPSTPPRPWPDTSDGGLEPGPNTRRLLHRLALAAPDSNGPSSPPLPTSAGGRSA